MRHAFPYPHRALTVCLMALVCLSLAASCQVDRQKVEVRVATSTTMLAAIVREVGGDRVSAAALVPAEIPPEQFEPGPRQLDSASEADLIVLSGWEEWAPDVSRAADEPERIAVTGIPGDLLLPYHHLDAADSVTEFLVRRDPDGEVFYRYNYTDYRSRIGVEAEDMCASVVGISGARVICAETQADFLDFLGFDIVGTYGGPEDMSRAESERLIEVGSRNEVALIVDDLHRGEDTGKGIAESIGVPRVALARYPARGSYIELLRSNTERIVSALE